MHLQFRLSFLTRQLGKLLGLLRIRYVATAAYPPVVNDNPQTFRPVEPPVEHVRNALAMLRTCGTPSRLVGSLGYQDAIIFDRTTVAAIVSRLWHAVELLEAADPLARAAAVELVHRPLTPPLTRSATTRDRRGQIEAHRDAEFQRALVRDV